MKKIFLSLVVAVAVVSCNSTETEKATPKQETMEQVEEKVIDVSKLTFASDKDPICTMPVKAGVADTATVDGKLYGFCAKECKEEFLKQAAAKK